MHAMKKQISLKTHHVGTCGVDGAFVVKLRKGLMTGTMPLHRHHYHLPTQFALYALPLIRSENLWR